MAKHGGFKPAMRPFFDKSSKRIEEAYAMHNIKLLRAISCDIDYQVVNHIPFSMASKMRRMLKDELGADFDAVEILQVQTIKKILIAEEIANCEEYRLVLDYLERLGPLADEAEELRKLKVLMQDYQVVRL